MKVKVEMRDMNLKILHLFNKIYTLYLIIEGTENIHDATSGKANSDKSSPTESRLSPLTNIML